MEEALVVQEGSVAPFSSFAQPTTQGIGHFLILSFFHVFRLSAYYSLLPVYPLGPLVSSFPYGCNEE